MIEGHASHFRQGAMLPEHFSGVQGDSVALTAGGEIQCPFYPSLRARRVSSRRASMERVKVMEK